MEDRTDKSSLKYEETKSGKYRSESKRHIVHRGELSQESTGAPER